MADIMLRTSTNNQVTCVANAFIDDYMKDANGEYVKVYLYLLRCLGRDDLDFSISEVADHLDYTEKDVMRAFTYWEKVGLLHLEYDHEELSGICLVDVFGQDQAIKPVMTQASTIVASTVPAAKLQAAGSTVAVDKEAAKPTYSPEQLDSFSSQEEVKELLYVTATYLGRPLSNSDSNSILYWYDTLKMPIDLIEYLVEYCIDNGHDSFHYMDTVARNWTDDGIKTVLEAQNASKSHTTNVYSVMKAMGISGRDLIDSELKFIDKWVSTLNFDIDIICEACTRTIVATNKPSFKYADSILMNWHKSGVKTLDAIKELDQQFVANSISKLQKAETASATNPRPVKQNRFNEFPARKKEATSDLEKSLFVQ